MRLDLIKVIIGFWAFILGAMVMAKVLGLAGDNKALIILVFAAALIYIMVQALKSKKKGSR
ncbi:hypothetical protein [Clostridium aminobutyricum]|uniref:Uncharacterized protein n=1 Tax=Clostridium aminobutyricum TaxID=33953 RepID=A0A939IIT9_CLOAM|nr:hypothetical protein [Clostridium aminobutyricum]MBN7772903.1 hypothetical protein [Clostridium aminobutyricum]